MTEPGEGNTGSLHGYEVSVLQDKKVLEIGWMYLTVLNCALRNSKDGKFCYVILPQLKFF